MDRTAKRILVGITGGVAAYKAAELTRLLIKDGADRTKRAVRDRIRQLPDGEIEWQKLQALAYGPLMRSAQLIEGVEEFICACRDRDIAIFIVSHKTEYANYDETRTNLRTAALEWMTDKRFFDAEGFDLSRADVYFESTRSDKIARIERMGCSHFIDDLEEVLLEPSFPAHVDKILYAPDALSMATGGVTVMPSWRAVREYFFDR